MLNRRLKASSSKPGSSDFWCCLVQAMPLQSSCVFASHIGHTGKSTLCFQVACREAHLNPNSSVLVVDFAEEGDLTKRLLGGADNARGLVSTLYGGIFELTADADKRAGAWFFGKDLDITKHTVQVSDHNPKVPKNLYLVSSGAWPRDEPQMDAATRSRVAGKVRDALEKSERTWRMFCDTDGDRRPNSLTMLAYGFCRHAVVPLRLSKTDLDRADTMLGMMAQMRERGEIQTQVAVVVWNCVKAYRDEPCEHAGMILPFQPTKVTLDILAQCNARLFETKEQLKGSGLFLQGGADQQAFAQQSVVVVREFADNVLKPSEDLGVPVARMLEDIGSRKSLPFESDGLKFEASRATVEAADGNIEALSGKLASMALGD